MAVRKRRSPSSTLSPAPSDDPPKKQIKSKVEVTTTDNSTKKRKRTVRQTTTKVTMKEDGVDNEASGDEAPQPKKKRTTAKGVKAEQVKEEVQVEENEDGTTSVKAKRQRKTKDDAADAAPLAERTVGSKLRVGAHVSGAKGVHNSVVNMVRIGANSFALFLKSQRTWKNPPLNDEHAKLFVEGCKKHNIDAASCCLPHGSYLVNLAHPDEERKTQAYGSFLDDLIRCHKLGILLYNFHPGNANGSSHDEGIRLIAEHINNAHDNPETGQVIPVLETMATLGNTIGGTFQDIADIISHVKNKDRIGVCLDTAHVFAAGYDILDDWEGVMSDFDRIIGLKYLKAFHMNDSKAPKSSNKDLHANIGTGYLGLRAFHNIVNDKRVHGLPMVLETPTERTVDGKKAEDPSVWAREIKMLEELVGADLEREEWQEKMVALQKEGQAERERIMVMVDKKIAKDEAAAIKKKNGKGKGGQAKKKAASESEDEDDEEE